MKKLFVVLLLVIAAATAYADSIPPTVWLNNTSGTVFITNATIEGAGSTIGGGTYWFGGNAVQTCARGIKFTDGFLTANLQGFVITGTLTDIFFNKTTGDLTALFSGHVGGHYTRGHFYESINPVTGKINYGYLQQTPEPSSLLLFASGLLGVVGVVRRKFAVH
jgi:hypothetical protein